MSKQSDQDLEKYLQGDSELSRNYHESAKDIEPPARLDKIILKSAKNQGSQSSIKTWLTQLFGNDWLTPATSSVMVILMAIGVFLLVRPVSDQSELDSEKDAVAQTKSDNEATHKSSKDKTIPVKDYSRKKTTKDAYIKKHGHSRNSPREWLAHINELYKHDKADVARVEFVKFRKMYPKYPVKKVLGDDPVIHLDPIIRLNKKKSKVSNPKSYKSTK